MPEASPELILEAAVSEWTVIVSVKVRDPDGTVRSASAGEVEVQIVDTDEATGLTTYNTTDWRRTDSSGRVTFRTSEYSWLAGWTTPFYSNRFRITARFVDYPDIAVGKDIWLGLTTWTDPGEYPVTREGQPLVSKWEEEGW